MSLLPTVTVIMPIRNEARFIERSLGAVLAQDYPADRTEILVVDGLSTDDTRQIVTRMLAGRLNAHLLENPRHIVPTAMNLGLAVAQGDYIVRVDGHTIIASDYLTRCVATARQTGADMVGGPMRTVAEGEWGEAVAMATSHPLGVGGSVFHYATTPGEVDSVYLGAWPRKTFERVGTFDEELVRNQDDEFGYRLRAAGGRIWLDPDIRSSYYVRPTLSGLWRQYFQYGYWKVRVFQKVPGSSRLRHWAPPLFALGFLGGLLILPLGRVWRWLYALGLGIYIATVLVVSAQLAARSGWRQSWRLPLAFATMHLAYGLGFWKGVTHFGLPWRAKP